MPRIAWLAPVNRKDTDGNGGSYEARGGYQRPVSIVTPGNSLRDAVYK